MTHDEMLKALHLRMFAALHRTFEDSVTWFAATYGKQALPYNDIMGTYIVVLQQHAMVATDSLMSRMAGVEPPPIDPERRAAIDARLDQLMRLHQLGEGGTS